MKRIGIMLMAALTLILSVVLTNDISAKADDGTRIGSFMWGTGSSPNYSKGLKVGQYPSTNPYDYVKRTSWSYDFTDISIYDNTEYTGHPDSVVYAGEAIKPHCYTIQIAGKVYSDRGVSAGDKVYLTLVNNYTVLSSQVANDLSFSIVFRVYYVEVYNEKGELYNDTFYVSDDYSAYVDPVIKEGECLHEWQNLGTTKIHVAYMNPTGSKYVYKLDIPEFAASTTETNISVKPIIAAHERKTTYTNYTSYESHSVDTECKYCNNTLSSEPEACTITKISDAVLPTNTSKGRTMKYTCSKCGGKPEGNELSAISYAYVRPGEKYYLTSDKAAKWKITEGKEYVTLIDNEVTVNADYKASEGKKTLDYAVVVDENSKSEVKIHIKPTEIPNNCKSVIGLLVGESYTFKANTTGVEPAIYDSQYSNAVIKTTNGNTITATNKGYRSEWVVFFKDGEIIAGEIVQIRVEDKHTPKNYVSKATLTTNGKIENRCSTCGKLFKTTNIYAPKTFSVAAAPYTGKEVKPAITIKDTQGNVIANTNYTVTYSNNINMGTAKAKIVFKNNYQGTKEISFTITMPVTTIDSVDNTAAGAVVKFSKTLIAQGYYIYRKDTQAGSWHYVGAVSQPASGTMVSYTDKTVENGVVYYYAVKTYKKDSAGKTTIGNSSLAKNTLYLKNSYISSVTNSASKTMLVKYSKNDKATGYEIAYCPYSTFGATSTKTAKVTGAATLSKIITGLTVGKTYYVKVRVYKTVGNFTFYSDWSAAKTVKIAK